MSLSSSTASRKLRSSFGPGGRHAMPASRTNRMRCRMMMRAFRRGASLRLPGMEILSSMSLQTEPRWAKSIRRRIRSTAWGQSNSRMKRTAGSLVWHQYHSFAQGGREVADANFKRSFFEYRLHASHFASDSSGKFTQPLCSVSIPS